MKNFPRCLPFFFEHRQKTFYYIGSAIYLVLIYTPKEANSQIFVTGGSVFARQMLVKK